MKNNQMKFLKIIHYILILLLLQLSLAFKNETLKKGCEGKYYISGIAYLSDNSILKNEEITVSIGNENRTILTDDFGKFEIEIKWINTCPSGLSNEEHQKENDRLNPQFIFIQYMKTQIKLENKWGNYAKCLPDSKEQVTWEKDLYFPLN